MWCEVHNFPSAIQIPRCVKNMVTGPVKLPVKLSIARCNLYLSYSIYRIAWGQSVHLMRLSIICWCRLICGTADQPDHVPTNGTSHNRTAHYLVKIAVGIGLLIWTFPGRLLGLFCPISTAFNKLLRRGVCSTSVATVHISPNNNYFLLRNSLCTLKIFFAYKFVL